MKFNTKRAPRALLRLPYLPILIAPFILFSPVLFTGKSLFWGTPALQFHPWRAFAWETLRAGHLPLWNPLVGMGAPLAANYQSAFFYPPGWIYFILAALGGEAAMAWGQALLVGIHLTLAGVGMAVLVRELGLGVLSQTISGLAFGLSGYLAARSHFLSINAAAAWLPWVLWGTYRLVNSRKSAGTRKNSILPPSLSLSSLSLSSLSLSSLSLSLFVSFLLLAGHAQMAWYTLLLAGMWAGFWGWRIAYSQTNPKDGGRGMLLEGIREVARAWLVLLVPVLLGVGLAAVQLIPTAELLLQSQRGGGANYDFVMTYSFWPWRFLGYLVPDLFGNPARGDYWGYANYWEDAVYVGLLPFLLALRAIFDRKKPAAQKSLVRFLLVLLVVTFVLALGQNTPVFPWLYRRVPTFNLFQAPARYTIWATFVFVLLAGYGAETWKRPIGPKARFRTIRWIVAAIAIVIAALAAGVIVPDIQPSFVRATALAGAFGIGAGVLTLFAPKPSPLSPLPSLSPLSPLPSLSPISPLPS
ncbi:MAG: YfhO family protein, partial [Anaerolineales bacterium]